MSISNETRVTQIANAILFSDLSSTDLKYWTNQLDTNVYTPIGLTLLATQMSLFKDQNLPLATMYYCAFGTFATVDQIKLWRSVVDNGASLLDVGETFVSSREFYTKYPTAANSASAKLDALVASSGVALSSKTKAYGLEQISKGKMGWGDILMFLANNSEKQLSVGLALLNTSVSGDVPTATEISALGSDLNLAIGRIFDDNPVEISNDYTGTSTNDIHYANSETDGFMRGLAGDDILYCGSGVNTIIFESTKNSNGLDTIYDFNIEDDVLNFSKFLNVTNATYIDPVSSTSTDEFTWKNGAVLVTYGNALDDSTSIAGLFGATKAYASPTEGTKAVIISADIVGDAKMWYIVNKTDTSNITSDEIYEIGILKDINNFSLLSFESTNFA